MDVPSLTVRTFPAGRASLVVAGGSLGGHQALADVLEQLPAELPVPLLVVQHVGASSWLREILAERTVLPVKWANGAENLQPGHVYVAAPEHHLRISRRGCMSSRRGDKVNFACPAVDPLFYSAARYYGRQVIAVVLSGRLRDGAAGARAISGAGGIVIVQAPATCAAPEMPRAAIESTHTTLILPPRSIGHAIVSLTMPRGTDALLGVGVASREM
jgi:two-component system chemotaxis response regulator CheB